MSILTKKVKRIIVKVKLTFDQIECNINECVQLSCTNVKFKFWLIILGQAAAYVTSIADWIKGIYWKLGFHLYITVIYFSTFHTLSTVLSYLINLKFITCFVRQLANIYYLSSKLFSEVNQRLKYYLCSFKCDI